MAPVVVPPTEVPVETPGVSLLPPDEQLEKWMMNTVKEGDPGARFLRTMLRMNPAYGTYLQTDADLINVVQMFAKRIKTKISQFETPNLMPPNVLIQPLCEMLWRVVGYVMHGVIELEEEANMPVPKEASGMIRMLLNTNTQLSNKLNELRRVYLKELSEHRDKQRRITPVAARAVANLQEHPIMFFEPLEFVLDDTTKDFVREAVVERIKLEMRTAFQSNDDNAEVAKYIEELEEAKELLQAEVKTCRATINRLEEQNKTLTDRDKKQKEELANQKQQIEELTKNMAELEKKFAALEAEMSTKKRRIEHLEAKLAEAAGAPKGKEVEVQHVDNTEALEELSQKLLNLEADNQKKSNLIDELNKKLADAKAALSKQGGDVHQDDPETQRLLDQALKVERELRAANEALEKALAEVEQDAADLRQELEDLRAASNMASVETPSGKSGPSAAEMAALRAAEEQKAMKKLNAQFQKEKDAMQAKIDKLTKQLEEAQERIADLEESLGSPSEKKTKVVKQVGVPAEEHTALKVKLYETEQKLEKLEDEYALLEQKVQMLMDKLKEKFSDSEMSQILAKIQLAPPPIRKKRKKKAYERLYDDAQRRILELKMRQEKLKQLEEKSLRSMARVIASSRDARKVEMLGHLHKANQQSADRFHDALSNFQQSATRRGVNTGLEDPLDSEDEEAIRRSGGGVALSELEAATLECFKDGVCPRCAFSALASIRLNHAIQQRGYQGAGLGAGAGGLSGGASGSFGSQWNSHNATVGGRPDSTRSGSPSAAVRLASPLGSGPQPGAMPFDAAFPMPAPPWRQERTSSLGSMSAPLGPASLGASLGSMNAPPGAAPLGASLGSMSAPMAATSGSQASLGSTASAPSLIRPSPSLGHSSVPSRGKAEGLGRLGRSVAEGGGGSPVSAMQFGAGATTPPWRRARSDSPLGVDGKGNSRSPSPGQGTGGIGGSRGSRGHGGAAGISPPQTQAPNPRQGGMMPMPSYGRIGRTGDPQFEPPPVPGRLPAAQTMALDPIGRNVSSGTKDPITKEPRMPHQAAQQGMQGTLAKASAAVRTLSPGMRGTKDPSPRRQPARSRSSSSDNMQGLRAAKSDGHRKMYAVSDDVSKQFAMDLGRPSSTPSPFGVNPASQREATNQTHQGGGGVGTGNKALLGVGGGGGIGNGTKALLGGGGLGTAYKNISAKQLPTVPSMRSVPNLSHAAPPPWNTPELPWETSPAAKRLAPKARKDSGSGGFMVTAIASQERMAATEERRRSLTEPG